MRDITHQSGSLVPTAHSGIIHLDKNSGSNFRNFQPANETALCEQSPSKTHQRVSKRGSVEIVSSLLSHHSPSFWAGHSAQTGLGSVRMTRQKSNLERLTYIFERKVPEKTVPSEQIFVQMDHSLKLDADGKQWNLYESFY